MARRAFTEAMNYDYQDDEDDGFDLNQLPD
jgi:hypothetical protein